MVANVTSDYSSSKAKAMKWLIAKPLQLASEANELCEHDSNQIPYEVIQIKDKCFPCVFILAWFLV